MSLAPTSCGAPLASSFVPTFFSLPPCGVDGSTFSGFDGINYGSMNAPQDPLGGFSSNSQEAADYASTVAGYGRVSVSGVIPLMVGEVMYGSVDIASSHPSEPSLEGSMICFLGEKERREISAGITAAPGKEDIQNLLCTVKRVPVEELAKEFNWARELPEAERGMMGCVPPVLIDTAGNPPTGEQARQWVGAKTKPIAVFKPGSRN
jgi:hypothetical protein